uniref:CCHC-type domain-containing protein n=1 Tax=Neogobius melanostomus TaxID=47308 RepID=A0A8C6WF61_9GOBI
MVATTPTFLTPVPTQASVLYASQNQPLGPLFQMYRQGRGRGNGRGRARGRGFGGTGYGGGQLAACFNCGDTSHWAKDCPNPPARVPMGGARGAPQLRYPAGGPGRSGPAPWNRGDFQINTDLFTQTPVNLLGRDILQATGAVINCSPDAMYLTWPNGYSIACTPARTHG